MTEKGYLYCVDDSYILMDKRNNSFYAIPVPVGEAIIRMPEKERARVLDRVLEQKSQAVYGVYEVDREECSRLILVLTQYCNLACKYCYAQDGTYGCTTGSHMDFETAKAAIDLFIGKFKKGIKNIQFFGGEPLLNPEVLERVCKYCEALYQEKKIDKRIGFTISTNGILIDEYAKELFHKYHINVTVSLDGPKTVNDKQRVYCGNDRSVYDDVIHSINYLNEGRDFGLSVEITLSQYFIDLTKEQRMQFLDSLSCMNLDSIHVVPVISMDSGGYTINNSEGLSKVFDEITDVTLRTIHTPNPMYLLKCMDMLGYIINHKAKSNFCYAGITNFAVDTKGDIYPCFMFINEEKEMSMGNVKEFDELKFSKIGRDLLNNTYTSAAECKDCIAKGVCTNCIASSWLMNGRLNAPSENVCACQKAMLKRIGFHLVRTNKQNMEEAASHR